MDDRRRKDIFKSLESLVEERMALLDEALRPRNKPKQQPLIPDPPAKKPKAPKKMATTWITAGQAVEVHGLEISSGFFYLGETLNGMYGNPEPSQVNPRLDANLDPASAQQAPGFYPRNSYTEFSPVMRGNYLHWLAAGRPSVGTPRMFLDLFLAGIERRLTTELLHERELRGELPSIRLELERLEKNYRAQYGVTDRIAHLLDLIDVLAYEVTGVLSDQFDLADTHWIPLRLYQVLADRAERREPIMGPLALAWAWHHPSVPRRSAATRYPEEFKRLFLLRFAEAYPNGISIKVGKRVAKLSYSKYGDYYYYQQSVFIREVPNIFANTGQLRKISWVFYQAENELGAFSRAMTGARTNFDKLAAIGALPRELIDGFSKQTDKLRKAVEKIVGKENLAIVSGSELITLWPVTTPGRITLPQTRALLRVLHALGFGVEPDIRFDGSPFTAETDLRVFRQPHDAPEMPDDAYGIARIVAVLSAMVVQADGPVSPGALELITRTVTRVLDLTAEAETRLHAHLHWLASKPIKINGLAVRSEKLGIARNERFGELICAIATAERAVSPAKLKMLAKAYAVLALDPALVTTHLHLVLTRDALAPAREPIEVRGGRAHVGDVAIPARPERGKEPKPKQPAVVLDHGVIEHKIEQSRTISAILADLFTDDDPVAPVPSAPTYGNTNNGDVSTIGPLDPAHSRLLRALAGRDRWTRGEFDALAMEHRLLPESAIDIMNEAAIDLSGEPLLEGDDELIVNQYAIAEFGI